FAYFEGLEDDIGEPIECDVIAICCDYQEMTIEEIIDQYSDLIDIEDMKASIANDDIDWIEDRYDYVKEVMEQHTTVIGYNHEDWSGLIIQSF
ncbi:hypothetical protein, partial [Streptomyces sp. P17]|uniref:hypothetical protein n=1 Tax=Streptomyces sp. P17 TaxID=3074716 RepID=UPI0028F426DA